MLRRTARHPGIIPIQPPLPPRAVEEELVFAPDPPAPPKRLDIIPPSKPAAKAIEDVLVERPKRAKRAKACKPKARRTAAHARARKPRRYDQFGEWQFMTSSENYVMARHPSGTVTVLKARHWYAMSKEPIPTVQERATEAFNEIARSIRRYVEFINPEAA